MNGLNDMVQMRLIYRQRRLLSAIEGQLVDDLMNDHLATMYTEDIFCPWALMQGLGDAIKVPPLSMPFPYHGLLEFIDKEEVCF